MRIEIPELCIVALVGVSGSGKSTFAKTSFKPTEVLSSDYFRALISDDENNQAVSPQAFDALYYVARKRLELGLLTVIDATNVQEESRKEIIKLAKEQNIHAVAIVLDLPESVCRERNAKRDDRNFGSTVIAKQAAQLKRSLKYLKKDGFRFVYTLKSEADIADCEIVRTPLWNDRKSEHGPFDIIGDVHGCYDELTELLRKLGYEVDAESFTAAPPVGRKAVFLGDLCDRGPKNAEVLRLVMNMHKSGGAYCVPGNHDAKLLKHLRGSSVQVSHGLAVTLEQIENQVGGFKRDVTDFIDGLISHYVFDDGKLVVAHAGLPEKYQGRASARVRDFCLYGDTNGETDEFGLPVRLPWAEDYRGRALVVYGHTPIPEVRNVNGAVCIDTGCVFGGKLTAYRYPERETVQVEAAREYYAPIRPLAPTEKDEDLLDIEDISGKRYIGTKLRGRVKVSEEQSTAALEVMSRYAADPHWLIYLPPTMSPCETSDLPEYLEYPTQAFEYYRSRGVDKVVCERKHMGSRSVIVLCRNAEVAAQRFGVADGSNGIISTRTGRHFFDDAVTERALLERLNVALDRSGFWAEFATDWVCLDAELMPWSAKARELVVEQYAPVGRAGRDGTRAAVAALESALAAQPNGAGLSELLDRYREKSDMLERYTDAYRRYCWTVNGIDDYRIAPFHILATEGKVWNTENHVRHMETIKAFITGTDPIFMATDYMVVDLADGASVPAATDWWVELTSSGGEGMVVKPYDFTVFKGTELLQPAVKCRGREYLRIIYGAEYTTAEHMSRLKKRSLNRKRNLALNEFALGIESLERFVGGEPLYGVHECVFGVLAMESEPVDPRL
ncbi:MAG: polynucleotide kinase-phosphatase [Oscillospiraceae bacterium]|jgi:protein phosphatase|nr:polynucleotide kinase-phosphatase [Oscillospiraceae bacterium]